MMQTVIFDFNRTLFDPDTESLLPGVQKMLQTLHDRNVAMHVISRNEAGRGTALETLGIRGFFLTVTFVEEKTPSMFDGIIDGQNSLENVFVVGDYLHEEIRLGNQRRLRTIWLQRGKFAHLKPESTDDVPWKTIFEMNELLPILDQ